MYLRPLSAPVSLATRLDSMDNLVAPDQLISNPVARTVRTIDVSEPVKRFLATGGETTVSGGFRNNNFTAVGSSILTVSSQYISL